MKIWVRLDGEAPEIGLGEMLAICESRVGEKPVIEKRLGLFLIADLKDNNYSTALGLADIGGFIKDSGLLIWSYNTREGVTDLNNIPALGTLSKLISGSKVKVDAEGFGRELNYKICARLGREIKLRTESKIDIRDPDYVVKVINSNHSIFVALTRAKKSPKWASRDLSLRPFKHPAMLKPKLARALVNLSRAKPDYILLDPFSGTGSVLIEAWMLGCIPVGVEINPYIASGGVENLKWAKVLTANTLVADSRQMPLTKADSIASDLPYGRMSSTYDSYTDELLARLVEQLPGILKNGGYAALMVRENVREHESREARIVEKYFYREHSALTRKILVYRVSG